MFSFTQRFAIKTLALIAVAGLATANAFAQTTSVAYWSFNDATGTETNAAFRANLFSADGGVNRLLATMSSDFTTADVATSGTAGITAFGGTLVNSTLPSGTVLTAGQDIGLQAFTGLVNNEGFLQFGVPTIGFEDVVLTYATRGSGTGFNDVQVSYSTDGSSFTDIGTAYAGNVTTYSTKTYNLSSIIEADNAANLQFRITFDGASNPTGNNRIDNIQINAVPAGAVAVPEAGSLALFAAPLLGLGAIVLRRRK